MTTLAAEHCVACHKGDPRVTPEEVELLLPQLAGWTLVDAENGDRLERTYRFGNFMEALAFTKRVGLLAERARTPSLDPDRMGPRAASPGPPIRSTVSTATTSLWPPRTDRLFALQDSGRPRLGLGRSLETLFVVSSQPELRFRGAHVLYRSSQGAAPFSTLLFLFR